MLILLSYAASGSKNTSCSCHPRYYTWDSSFRITNHETEDDLIAEIVRQVKQDKDDDCDKSYNHLVVRSIEDLIGFNMSVDEHSLEYSINVVPRYDIYDKENWEELEKYTEEGHKLQERLRTKLGLVLKSTKGKF